MLRRYLDLWVIDAIGLAAALLVLVGAPVGIRIPIGLVAAAALPGYLLGLLLIRRGELDSIERTALSISLSVAVLIVLAPIADRLPGRVSAPALVAYLTLTTLALALVVGVRRRDDDQEIQMPSIPRFEMDRRKTVAAGVIVVALLVALALFARLFGPAPLATEFYVNGWGGGPSGVPSVVAVNAPVAIPVSIVSHEPNEQRFRITAAGNRGILDEASVAVGAGETLVATLRVAMPTAGPDQEVTIALFRDADAAPYRSLRLTLDVVADPNS